MTEKTINPEKEKLHKLLTVDWDGIHPTQEFFERYREGRTYSEMILAYEREARELSRISNRSH